MPRDPYWEWLKVPADRRPPNHYELLGLTSLEPDVERIRQEAMQRISHVRRYQLGDQSEAAIRLLGELAAAFDTLTTPDRKRAYDGALREQSPAETPTPAASPGPDASPSDFTLRTKSAGSLATRRRARTPRQTVQRNALILATAGCLAAGLAYLKMGSSSPTPVAKAPAVVQQPRVPAIPSPAPSRPTAPTPATPQLPALPAPAEVKPETAWKRLFASPAEITAVRGVQLRDGVIDLDSTGLDDSRIDAGDCILRANVQKLKGQNITLRLRVNSAGYYSAWFNGGRWFGIGRRLQGRWVDLKQGHSRKNCDGWFEYKFAAVGDRLQVWADGVLVVEARDSTHASGAVGIGAGGGPTRGKGLFRDVEWQSLDQKTPSGEEN